MFCCVGAFVSLFVCLFVCLILSVCFWVWVFILSLIILSGIYCESLPFSWYFLYLPFFPVYLSALLRPSVLSFSV